MNDLISVIVPVYNVEYYLRQCLDSIITQTYNNLDIILINNGSTDQSGQICEEYAATDDRVRVFHQDNLGVSSARNRGIDLAQGSYLAFIDADDWVSEDYLATLYQLVTSQQADFSMVDYCRFVESDGSYLLYHQTHAQSVIGADTYIERMFQGLKDTYVVVWGKLFVKELFNQGTPTRFLPARIGEDAQLMLSLILKEPKIVLQDSTLYCWRKRQGSATAVALDLSAIEDDVKMLEDRLLQLYLSGRVTAQVLDFYRHRLLIYQRFLEEQELTQTTCYLSVIGRLALLND